MAENIGISSVAPKVAPQQAPVSQGSAQSAAKAVVAGSDLKQVEATVKTDAAANTVEQAKISAEKLQASVDQLNQFMKDGQRSLAFSVDDSADEVVVTVADRQSGDVIRQIPTPEALEMRKQLDSILGMLFSETV